MACITEHLLYRPLQEGETTGNVGGRSNSNASGKNENEVVFIHAYSSKVTAIGKFNDL